MRGKKAKQLRRMARQMTTGMENVKYHDRALNPAKPTRRTRHLYECTRHVYKALKQQYRAKA